MSTALAKAIMTGGALALALALGACNSTAPAVATAAAPSEPVVAAPEPPAAGVVGAAIGRELDEHDKQKAIAAQQEAVNAGVRKTWRGAHGAYGFIEPGAEGGVSGCRDYTHKIYINGRPQEAKGQACKGATGWRVTS